MRRIKASKQKFFTLKTTTSSFTKTCSTLMSKVSHFFSFNFFYSLKSAITSFNEKLSYFKRDMEVFVHFIFDTLFTTIYYLFTFACTFKTQQKIHNCFAVF